MEERIWRGWVCAELVQFVTAAAKDPEVRNQGLARTLKEIAYEFRKRLDLKSLPATTRKQILLVSRGSA